MKTLPMMCLGWLEDVIQVMLLMLLDTRSCSSVFADQMLISLFWIGECVCNLVEVVTIKLSN